ncbi:aspartyl protease family protein [Galbibacter sp. EGI 63066]|uniref:aspartyl protease family protein n=1 Tax=Galbibacter sp. EGI 63066 TaxID=2993559 RepID=UPI00224994BA|nr:aspartyl protease family protein [Galbibacter sp. EGI 63066]MCX2679809.1 aspartyl protease family protein [Galbibacter sp. EGI 63066]
MILDQNLPKWVLEIKKQEQSIKVERSCIKHIFVNTLITIMLSCSFSYGQDSFIIADGKHSEKLRFEFINNLIIIPVEINGVPFSFILDTGVSKPILFNLATDSLQISNAREIIIKGLGEGEPVKAIHTKGSTMKIGGLSNKNQDLYILSNTDFNLSSRIGKDVDGIMSYELLKGFVVKINFPREVMKFYNPSRYKYKKCRKCETKTLALEQDKIYIKAMVTQHPTSKPKKVKLLLDTGSSNAIWLFKNKKYNIAAPTKYFEDILGVGLNGKVSGKRSRIEQLVIGKYNLQDVKVAYPDSSSLQYMPPIRDRNGPIGMEVLKRFHLILDYPNNRITYKKNYLYDKPFKYNMSGIDLRHNGLRAIKDLVGGLNDVTRKEEGNHNGVEIMMQKSIRYELLPAIEIADVRDQSPAHKAGLQEGDIVLKVNGKETHKYSLQEVTEILNEKVGKKIKLIIERGGSELKFSFVLNKVL